MARDLGVCLLRGNGTRRDAAGGVDLLLEAALRADRRSARYLCLALLDAGGRAAAARASYRAGFAADFGLEPDLPLAAACARLVVTGGDDTGRTLAAQVISRMRDVGVPVPEADAAAFRVLWRSAVRRRQGDRRSGAR